MSNESIKVLQSLAQAIYDKKGMNILALDIRDVSSIAEYFLIAEGSVERHVQALSRIAVEKLEENGIPIFHTDGDQTGDWVVLDCGRILIHLFIPQLREKYALEELWKEGKLVDLNIDVGQETSQ